LVPADVLSHTDCIYVVKSLTFFPAAKTPSPFSWRSKKRETKSPPTTKREKRGAAEKASHLLQSSPVKAVKIIKLCSLSVATPTLLGLSEKVLARRCMAKKLTAMRELLERSDFEHLGGIPIKNIDAINKMLFNII
jgi:hypothetical protein